MRRIHTILDEWLYRSIKRYERELAEADIITLKRELASCGEGTQIYGPFHIIDRGHIDIGSNVHIAKNCWIHGSGGLTIGDNTHISRNLVLYTVNHRYEGERVPYDEELVKRPVTIGRNVWIGMNVCITPGTIIGEGAIIGLGTVVSGEVPPLAIVGGQKWRILKYRDRDHYERLDRNGEYGGISGRALLRVEECID